MGGKSLTALFDSGYTFSCIPSDCAELLDKPVPVRHPFKIEMAEKDRTIEINSRVMLDFYIDGYRFSDEFVIVPNLSEEVIIGAKTLQIWRFKLDFDKDEIVIDPRAARLRLV